MKIIVIGGHGTIGQAVCANLEARHEVVKVGSKSGQFQADMSDIGQVRTLFEQIGQVDAVVVAAGIVHWGPLAQMTPDEFRIGFNSKVMGQVNVAQVAAKYLNDGGSITLTSGILTEEPIREGAAATMANRAVEGYARAAAIELPRSLRINVVSPTLVDESIEVYGPYFIGFATAPAVRVACAYSRSVEGAQTGQVYRVW